jgi:hypothetical protein
VLIYIHIRIALLALLARVLRPVVRVLRSTEPRAAGLNEADGPNTGSMSGERTPARPGARVECLDRAVREANDDGRGGHRERRDDAGLVRPELRRAVRT